MKHLTTEPPTSSTLRLTSGARNKLDVMSNWHGETHDGRFELCMEQPCHAVQRVDGREPWRVGP